MILNRTIFFNTHNLKLWVGGGEWASIREIGRKTEN